MGFDTIQINLVGFKIKFSVQSTQPTLTTNPHKLNGNLEHFWMNIS